MKLFQLLILILLFCSTASAQSYTYKGKLNYYASYFSDSSSPDELTLSRSYKIRKQSRSFILSANTNSNRVELKRVRAGLHIGSSKVFQDGSLNFFFTYSAKSLPNKYVRFCERADIWNNFVEGYTVYCGTLRR